MDEPQFTQEDIDMMAELGVNEDQLAALQQKLDEARYKQGLEAPQGNTAGGIYIAANPLQHAAHAMQGVKAGMQEKAYEGQQQQLIGQRGDALRAFGGMMNRGQQQPGMGMDPNGQGRLLREYDAQRGLRGS